MSELNTMAKEMGIENFGTMRKHEIIFQILQENAEMEGSVLRRRTGNFTGRFRVFAVAQFQLLAVPGRYLRFTLTRSAGSSCRPAIRSPARFARRRTRNASLPSSRSKCVDTEDPDIAKDKTHFDNLTPTLPGKTFPPGNQSRRTFHRCA